MNRQSKFVVVAACLSLVFASSALAFEFVQQGVQPVYQFEVFEDSGLLPPGSMGNLTLDFQALGTANISIDDADLIAFAQDPTLPIPLSAVSGTFFGEMPAGTVAPEGTPFTLRALELVSGQLENVSADDMGNITGADANLTLLFSHDLFVGTPDELRLFGAEMTFTGSIDSVPFSVGTSFTSPEAVGLFLNSPSGPQVGLVKNRFLNIVPEPSSLVLLGLGGLALLGLRSGRRG